MTTFRKHLLTAFAALSLGTAAFSAQAQDTTTQGAAPAHGERADRAGHRAMPTPAQRAAARAQRIARLHDELKITPAQESAWNSFVASMQPPARAAHDRTADRSAWANMTAPERMAKMIDLQKQRTAALEQRQGALSSFYSVLNPDQKKTFDARASRLQGRLGEHGGGQQRGGTARG